MALFEDFGNIDTGNPYLNFISGFDTTANSTKTNVSALPKDAEAEQKKKDELKLSLLKIRTNGKKYIKT